METKLIETLKPLTIPPKCITLQLEGIMTNPKLLDSNKDPHPRQNCSICEGDVIGKKYKREELKKSLFTVFTASVKRGGIKGKQTAKAITRIEGTLLIMIATGLFEYAIRCDKEEDEIVVLELASRQGFFAIHDDDAWNIILSRYFCK